MNIKLNMSIELNKARVELTNDQKESVRKFIGNILMGDKAVKTSRYMTPVQKTPAVNYRILGARSWNVEEEKQFLELAGKYSPTTKNQTELFSKIGNEMNRTPLSLLNRLSIIRRGLGHVSPVTVPEGIPSLRYLKR